MPSPQPWAAGHDLEINSQLYGAASLLLSGFVVCNVLVMVSYFGKSTGQMAFLTGDAKDYLACCLAYSHAQETLAAWLQGRERFYAVQFVIDEFTALFGPGAVQPVAMLIEAATREPDDDADTCGARARLVTEALDMIGQQLRAMGAVTHVPYRD